MKNRLLRTTASLALLIFAAIMLTNCASIPKPCPFATKPGQHRFRFDHVVTTKVSIDYVEFLPEGFPDKQEKWPLVLFLHARQERGEDLDKMLIHGPPRLIYAECRKFPFILLVPQCPSDDVWYSDTQAQFLTALLDSFVKQYPVDTDRIYVTGISMGGGGTWKLAVENPDRFAAIIPMSTRGAPERAAEIKHIPTWVFHGAKDFWVPLTQAEEMVDALKKAGSDVRFTVYPDQGHTAWNEAYNDPALYEWMLKQRRKRIPETADHDDKEVSRNIPE